MIVLEFLFVVSFVAAVLFIPSPTGKALASDAKRIEQEMGRGNCTRCNIRLRWKAKFCHACGQERGK